MRFARRIAGMHILAAAFTLTAAGLLAWQAKILFLLALMACGGWFLCRHGGVAQRAGAALLPLAAGLLLAWCAAGMVCSAQKAALALKDLPPPPAPSYRAWIGAEPAQSPADKSGRVTALVGGAVGLALAAFLRPRARHGPGVVQGERVERGGWADLANASQVCAVGPPKPGDGGIVLGRLQALDAPPDRHAPVLRVKPGAQGMAAHTFVFGASGSGKTFGFVLPNIISTALEGWSIVGTDPKGELVAGKYNVKDGKRVYTPGVAGWLKSRGYRVLILNLKNPSQGSHRWNPVLEAKDEAEFRRVTEAMIYSKGKDNPFFAGGELNLFTALIGLVRYGMEPQYQHLRAVLSILAWPQEAIDAAFEEAYRGGKLPFYYYEKWQAAKPLFSNFMTGVQNKVAEITEGPLARVLAGHDFDLESIGKEKTALFVILPTMGDLRPVLACFYFMLFKRLVDLAEKNFGRLPVPVRFIMDEFANIGRVPDFEQRISFDRGFGVNYVCILQALSQFTDLYGAAATQTVLANADVQVSLRVNDAKTAQHFASMLGEAETWHISERRDVTAPWGRLEVPKKTESLKKTPLLYPWQFRELPFYTAVALIPTCRPIPLRTYAFSDMREFGEIPQDEKTVADFAPPVPEDLPLPEPPEVEDGPAQEQRKRRRKRGGPEPGDVDQTVADELGI
ncbi:MAG: type IV secretory system conjugative DNA transfer family protein [Bacillota bacterium]